MDTDGWLTETAFSSMKRMFGEHVSATRFQNMVKEMMIKVSLYNLFRRTQINRIRCYVRIKNQATKHSTFENEQDVGKAIYDWTCN